MIQCRAYSSNHDGSERMKYKFYFSILFAVFCSVILLTGNTGRQTENSIPGSLKEADHTPSEAEALTAESVTSAAVTTNADAAETTVTATETTIKKTDPPADLILTGKDTVEACADLTLDEFITERNVALKDGAVLLNTAEVGTFDVEIPYLYNGEEFTRTLRYRVADTTKPIIINWGEQSYHKAGTAFDLNQYIGFCDNYDRHPLLTYEGEVDPDTVGNYPLAATVTDSSGNAVSWKLTIHVVEKLPKSADKHRRVDFSDFISRYDGENVRFGIDVSAWQGDIDFLAVRDAGCSFVIIRAGYCYSQLKPDDYFRQNLRNAAEAGLDVGVYFYTADHTEADIREHVRWIADQLEGQELALPIVCDWEEFSHFQKYGMSIRDLNDIYAAFADEVIKQGYQPMLYSSKYFFETVWSERTKRSTPIWLAHYVRQTSYQGEYAIWQVSPYGRIPGIAGDVDLDIQYLNKTVS